LSWEDQGYSCVDELYNEMADILDKKFTLTQSLTYFTMGGYSDVDTSKYRNAIWMYIQSLYGIRHDDYNYGEVNVMLSREMKTFIKTICCFPDRTTSALRQSVMVDFKSSEKV
uniref:AAA_lid_11 domain-containing protein n=1 Tax=Gongylonema pulchrum TaxID=637853 RepID=A0A183DMV7_9BILA